MAWRARCLAMGLVGITVGAPCEAKAAGSLDNPTPRKVAAHLRPASSIAAGMLEEGRCRSATFRSLVATVEASDLIVYVNARHFSSRRLAGGLQFAGATASNRFLRIVIGLTVDRIARIALLGHELQHAVEVAAAPDIRSRTGFDHYYRAHGVPGATQHAFDTEAARLAQARIRAEVAESLRAAGSSERRTSCASTLSASPR